MLVLSPQSEIEAIPMSRGSCHHHRLHQNINISMFRRGQWWKRRDRHSGRKQSPLSNLLLVLHMPSVLLAPGGNAEPWFCFSDVFFSFQDPIWGGVWRRGHGEGLDVAIKCDKHNKVAYTDVILASFLVTRLTKLGHNKWYSPLHNDGTKICLWKGRGT